MLKLNYTDCGLYLEHVAAPLEVAIAQRVMLTIAMGQPLCLEPGRASFLLTANVPGLERLKRLLESEREGAISIAIVDRDYVEVCVQGTWLASSIAADEGAFVAALSPELETTLDRLWQASQFQLAAIA